MTLMRGLSDTDRAAIRAFEEARGVQKLAPVVPSRKREVTALRRQRTARLHAQGKTVAEIATETGEAETAIRYDLAKLGLRPCRKRRDAALERKVAASERKAGEVKDRRRFKVTPVPMGEASRLAPADATGSIFPDRVFEPDGRELVLKDGANNAKIGGDVLVGRLKGAYIATLTLEERATCPKTCDLWRECYGNSMQHARRWKGGKALEDQLRHEVALACEKNELVLIRLHVLGDFYSFGYLCLWAELLDTHPNLHVFGFTAWPRNTQIGAGVAKLRKVYPDRFMVRTSGTSGRWGSFTLDFPTERKTIGDAIVCPEQVDAMSSDPAVRERRRGSRGGIHCGNCAACWSTSRPIAFVMH